MPQEGFSGDIDQLLAEGRAWSREIVETPADELTNPQILSLGYLERARIGLGSPFRLIDYVLRDPDLPDSVSINLSYAILGEALDGSLYQVRAEVLQGAHPGPIPRGLHPGAHHLRLVESVIEKSPSASSGERALRLGYQLAYSERSVSASALSTISHVGALVADRRRAQEDARRLLNTASQYGRDPLSLLRAWRAAGHFSVESPASTRLSLRDEEAVARMGPPVALALRTLAHRLSGPTLLGPRPARPTDERAGWLDREAAERLVELAILRNYPAQAPIAVAVRIHREMLENGGDLDPWQQSVRHSFAEQAWNEERLIAEGRVLRARDSSAGTRLSLIEVQAATYMRAWNQEAPWFHGDPSPAPRDVQTRFGLADLSFDPNVPRAWHPYYSRMIASAFTDLQRVLPTASLRGLSIRIGDLPGGSTALAIHEPRTRTLHFPPATGPGTLAHETGHDLDWQLARSRYGVRSGYATDLAVRRNAGDRIAASLVALTTVLSGASSDSVIDPHNTRPTEIFARGLDWFIAGALAHEGRSNGYLSSYQNEVLTGYGSTRPPDVSDTAVPALFTILDEVAPVSRETREWALDTYGPSRPLLAIELADVVAAEGIGQTASSRIREIVENRNRALVVMNASSCRVSSAEGLRRLGEARRQLVDAAANSAVRGAIIDEVRHLVTQHSGRRALPAANAWLAWRLYGAPEPAEVPFDEIIPSLEDRIALLSLMETRPEPVFTLGLSFELHPAICGGNPFASIARGAALPSGTATTTG